MSAKFSHFLQSDVFILLIALIVGFLCHLFVTTQILTLDKKRKLERVNHQKVTYAPELDLENKKVKF